MNDRKDREQIRAAIEASLGPPHKLGAHLVARAYDAAVGAGAITADADGAREVTIGVVLWFVEAIVMLQWNATGCDRGLYETAMRWIVKLLQDADPSDAIPDPEPPAEPAQEAEEAAAHRRQLH